MGYHYYQSKPGLNSKMQNTPSKGNGSDQKPGDKEKRRRQKTTAIALSILLVLTTMFVGYEMISHNEESTISSTNIVQQDPNLASLQESNRQQTENIRNLKKQLFETNQKLYEFKTNLFAKGDPQEKARLASLSHELHEKTRTTDEYATRIQELEQERQAYNQKISDMENSIRSLSEMTIVQRETKEQGIQSFQSKVAELETQLKTEKEVLTNTSNELEGLKEKTNHLIVELEGQYEAEIIFKKKIEEITANLEIETTKNRTLDETIAALQAKQSENDNQILNLKEQIAKTEEKQHQEYETLSTAHHDVSQQYEELQAVLQTFVTANESFNTEHEKLLTMLKKENENSTQLKEELELALANYSNTHLRAQSLEDELQKTSQKVASLQEELGLQHANLASKQNELDSEIVAHTLAKTESETTIAELRNSVENYQGNLHQKELDIGALTERHNEEKKRLHELNVAIQLAAAADINSDNRISQLQSLLEEKETITASLEHQLNERNAKIQLQNSETVQSYDTIAFLNQTIENYENELNQKETEIAALQAQTGDREHALATIEQLNHSINHYQNELTLREREVAAITAQHEFEKSQQQELNTSLENASLSKQYGDEEIVALRTQLEHSATAASSLEKLIHTQGSELNEVMQQYKQLSEALENEKLHSSGLHQALNNSLLEVENEQQKSVALHQLLQTNSATLTFLQERMAEKEKELELRSGIVALTTHEAELRVSQQQEQISHLMYEIQNEKQKTEQIIASNIEVREKAESLAQSTEQLLHKVNIHRKQIALLESDLYAKEASRDSLREEVVKLTAAFEEEKQNANQSMASTSEQEKVNTLKEELQQNIKELTHLFKVVSDKEEEIIALRNTTMAQKQIINKLNKEIAENRSFEKGEKDNF